MVIGLTGPSGAGKGVAADVFAHCGAYVIDCDALYHEMLLTDEPLRKELRAAFPDCADDSGGVDRRRLAGVVFADAEKLRTLNTIAHRAINRALTELLAAHRDENTVLDAPTLFEAGADALCDVTIAVLAPMELRRERLCIRDGLPPAAIDARFASQHDDAFFRAHCTYILENNGDLDAFRKTAKDLYHAIT